MHNHRLITNLATAFDWPEHPALGEFAVGTLPDGDLAPRLMTPQRLVDILMRRPVGLPRLRVLSGGVELHPNNYTDTVGVRRGPDATVLDPRRLARLLGEGATLVADAISEVDPTIELACRALDWWTGDLVRANCYLTSADAPGFARHWDDHDVIIVQLSGEKRWEVRATSRTAPMYRDIARNDTPPEEVLWSDILHPGQVLYIPRGHWHQATREGLDPGGHSLHVTFGFTRRTGINWLTWLADQARAEELLRRDLPTTHRGDQPQVIEAHAAAVVETATRLLAARGVAEMLADRCRTQAPARHAYLGPMFGAPDAVIAVTEFAPDIEVGPESVVVRAGGHQITFAPAAQAGLRLLLSGQPVRISGPDQQVLRVLATTLLEVGLCAPMTEALWSGCTGMLPTAN